VIQLLSHSGAKTKLAMYLLRHCDHYFFGIVEFKNSVDRVVP
jgi:hypothetical protein